MHVIGGSACRRDRGCSAFITLGQARSLCPAALRLGDLVLTWAQSCAADQDRLPHPSEDKRENPHLMGQTEPAPALALKPVYPLASELNFPPVGCTQGHQTLVKGPDRQASKVLLWAAGEAWLLLAARSLPSNPASQGAQPPSQASVWDNKRCLAGRTARYLQMTHPTAEHSEIGMKVNQLTLRGALHCRRQTHYNACDYAGALEH
jgi:hypothetical protein